LSKSIKKRRDELQCQSLGFTHLARIWKARVKEIEKSLWTVEDPEKLEKLLGELRNAIAQYRICRGLASFALAISKQKVKP